MLLGETEEASVVQPFGCLFRLLSFQEEEFVCFVCFLFKRKSLSVSSDFLSRGRVCLFRLLSFQEEEFVCFVCFPFKRKSLSVSSDFLSKVLSILTSKKSSRLRVDSFVFFVFCRLKL